MRKLMALGLWVTLVGCNELPSDPQPQWTVDTGAIASVETTDGNLVILSSDLELMRISPSGTIVSRATAPDGCPDSAALDEVGDLAIAVKSSCNFALYDPCTDPSRAICNAMDIVCHARQVGAPSLCTERCTATTMCPLQNGQPVPCYMGYCAPPAPNDCAAKLVSFDGDFQRRWSINVEVGCAPRFSVSDPIDADTNLDVAFVDTMGMLQLADASGAIRWAVPSQALRLRIADNGDVFAFEAAVDGPRRLRYASLDGSLLETTALPAMAAGDLSRASIQRDGSFVTALDPYHSIVTRVDSSGVLRWQRPLHTYVESVRLDRDDAVSAVSSLGTQILTFDGTSGATIDAQDNDVGQDARLLSADRGGYTMAMSHEIYRFRDR